MERNKLATILEKLQQNESNATQECPFSQEFVCVNENKQICVFK